MGIRLALGTAIFSAFIAAPAFGEPTESLPQDRPPDGSDRLESRSHRGFGMGSKSGEHEIPTWARDASWYQVDVARFRNGDPSNDPAGTLPWSAVWPPTAGGSTEDLDRRQYGGDLKGLESKLPYLRHFGINALCLSPIFTDDLRHVNESFGVKGSISAVADESADPTTWRFSPGDRVFLGFLKEAHRQGFRVVVDAGSAGDAERLLKATRRWMDPDGDGDPLDGIDGWMLRASNKTNSALGKRLRAQVKKINPKAILVAYAEGAGRERVADGWFDAAVSYEAGRAIRQFFSGRDKTYTLEKFFRDLSALRERHDLDTCVTTLSAVSGPDAGRLLSGLLPSSSSAAGNGSSTALSKPTEGTYDRWRLATIFQHSYLGAPITYYGDEVGMYGPAGAAARGPMWWDDLSSPDAKPGEYRGDFLGLVRFLNIRREVHAPLRHGDFRRVLLDEKRKILAFARTLDPGPARKPVPQPGNEVILVMNYGREKQQVRIPAGRPGQIIGLVAPQLKPPPGTTSLRMGGSRQQSDQSGEVLAWLKPMSVCIVLVDEKEGAP